jgi:hypothetical protein
MVRLFKPVWGTELMLNVRVGSIKPQKPPDTVVTELEFSACRLAHRGVSGRSALLTEYTSFQDQDGIWGELATSRPEDTIDLHVHWPLSVSLSATVNPDVPPPTTM